ncbi:MAG TPA: CoA pyrophosphatase [Micropepsaceae bacterium]|jgi:8-oxo-dGTP pyrophosphatase MutT (NUDIX family)
MVNGGIGQKTGTELAAGSLSRERIRDSLRRTPPELRPSGPRFRPAAILLPIVERAEPYALFTKRTDDLPSHAGQICFPGGRYHTDDETLIQTALREVEEEIGLSPDVVDVVGFLDSYETLNTGFTILPVVGYLRPDFSLIINPREVAEAFEAPLGYILDPKNHALKSVERDGVLREFYAIEYASHVIWGATAAMIVNLSERLGLR